MGTRTRGYLSLVEVERRRLQAAELCEQGVQQGQVAEVLRVGRQAVGLWHRACRSAPATSCRPAPESSCPARPGGAAARSRRTPRKPDEWTEACCYMGIDLLAKARLRPIDQGVEGSHPVVPTLRGNSARMACGQVSEPFCMGTRRAMCTQPEQARM